MKESARPRPVIIQPSDESIKLIALTQGKVCIVDASDYEWLNQSNWLAWTPDKGKNWYAQRRLPKSEGGFIVFMHRVIAKAPDGEQVDHRDGDGLNNRRSNHRICSGVKNRLNQRIRSDNTSGYKGVVWAKRKGKWLVRVGKKFVGYFDDPALGAKAYDVNATRVFGEFARLNFPIENQFSQLNN